MKYAAFLRGIGPSNPNMHGSQLRKFFEGLGFRNVQAIISSGNVVFETGQKNTKALEKKIEAALPQKLSFTSTTIIRSQQELKKLVESDPFNGVADTPTSRLNVTFLKKGGEIFTIINPTDIKTPVIMRNLEKQHGKEITTRTLKTVLRVLKKME